MKKCASAVRSTQEKVFGKNSALQAACDTSIFRVTGCVYPREGYSHRSAQRILFDIFCDISAKKLAVRAPTPAPVWQWRGDPTRGPAGDMKNGAFSLNFPDKISPECAIKIGLIQSTKLIENFQEHVFDFVFYWYFHEAELKGNFSRLYVVSYSTGQHRYYDTTYRLLNVLRTV